MHSLWLRGGGRLSPPDKFDICTTIEQREARVDARSSQQAGDAFVGGMHGTSAERTRGPGHRRRVGDRPGKRPHAGPARRGGRRGRAQEGGPLVNNAGSVAATPLGQTTIETAEALWRTN